jgi:hypothetical protein
MLTGEAASSTYFLILGGLKEEARDCYRWFSVSRRPIDVCRFRAEHVQSDGLQSLSLESQRPEFGESTTDNRLRVNGLVVEML